MKITKGNTLVASAVALALFSAGPAVATCVHASPGGTCVQVAVATPTVAAGPLPFSLHVWGNHALSNGGIPSVGYDITTARSQFVAVMNYNFNPNLTWSRWIMLSFVGTNALTDVELARLTKQYAAEGGFKPGSMNLLAGSPQLRNVELRQRLATRLCSTG